MKVIKYCAHNIMRIQDIQFNLEGRHLFLVGGKNDQGKSSSLMALLMALCGKSGMENYPEVALRQGEDKGSITVQLSGDDVIHEPVGLTVEMFFRRKLSGVVMEEFRVLDSTGQESAEPRKTLQRFCALKGFDPLAFERMDKKAKRDLIAKLLGLDFTELKDEYKQRFAERTQANREVKDAEARYKAAQRFSDAPKEEMQASDIMAELEAAEAKNTEFTKATREVELVSSKLDDSKKVYDEACERVEAAKRMVEKAIEATTLAMHTKLQLESALEKAQESQKTADAARVDVTPIKQRLKGIDSINRKVRANAEADRLAAKYKEALTKSEKLTRRLQEIDQEIAKQMDSAKWPVPGLGLTEDGVTFNGLPFEQASKSTRIMTSVAVGMALNPKLRLLVCQDGNDLDTDTMSALQRILEENDFQMLVELVTRSSADEDLCAVVIEDGEVSIDNTVPADAPVDAFGQDTGQGEDEDASDPTDRRVLHVAGSQDV